MEYSFYKKDGSLKKIHFSRLSEYIESDSFEVSEFLIYLDKYLEQKSENINGLSGFLWSVFNAGNLQAAEVLLSKGINLNYRTEYGGMTTFLYAARDCKSVDVLKTLVKYGADIKSTSKYGTTALQFASMSNPNPKVIDYLVGLGLSTIIKDHGRTLLMLAAQRNENPEVLETLMRHGNNIYEYNKDWGCLVYAVRENRRFEIVEFILQKAYRPGFFRKALDINHPDHRNRTPLMYALQSCTDKEIIFLLLGKGANPCITDKHGWSGLRFAINYWSIEIVEYLLEQYSFEDNVDSLHYLPFFEFACLKAHDWALLPLLIKHEFVPSNLEKCIRLAQDSKYQGKEKIEFLNSLDSKLF